LLLKELFGQEEALEQAREKLVLRCNDFNTQAGLKLFEPTPDEAV